MSYESVKLAQLPTLYYRLDQGGFGVNGESVPDLSGNGLDATLTFNGDAPAWGHTSPIETDPASREFWGYTNAGIYGFNGASTIARANDAILGLGGGKDFTVGEWLRPMDNIPLAGDFGMVAKQGTGGTLQTFNGGTRIGGFCFDSAATLWKVVDLSFVTTDHIGESFYVVVVRTGDALALYINGTLRNFTTVASGLPTLSNSSPFYIQPATLFYTNARHDEAEYHTRALSAAEILESYEAALNSANARAQCDIRTTAILSARDEPDPIAYPFRHNWSKPVVERLRFKSSVFKPTDGSTELRRQRSSPRRQVEYQHLLYNEDLSRRFMAMAFGGRTRIVQFEPDKVRVGNLLAGATSVAFDTRYLDFEVGQQALIYQNDDTYEHVTLTVVTDGGIEWLEGLSQNYNSPWIKPTRVARLPLNHQMAGETDTVGDSSVQYDYLEEDEPLNPRRITPFVATLTYKSRELWDLREWQGHDYSEIPQHEWATDRSMLDENTGAVATKTYRWGAEQLQPWNMNLQGRELIAKYLGWIYERAGQSNPFWMPTFRQDLKPLGSQTNQLRIAGHDYTDLYAPADNRKHLAFVYFDNTVVAREIVSATTDGVNDLLELDANVPTLSNLRWLCFLRRVILSSDDIEWSWETDNVIRTAWAVIDAPLDFALGSPSPSSSPSLSASPSPSPSHSPSPSVSPSGSASPSFSVSPSHSGSPSQSPSGSASPSSSESPSPSPSVSPSASGSPSHSESPSVSPSASTSPSSSPSQTPSPSHSVSPSSSASPSV